jgi:hypothetical protein
MFLSKKNNVKKLLSGQIHSGRQQVYDNETVLNRKSAQISFGITQASEYYRAAELASIATSPLLYFYGMLSLAKSMLVANKEELYFEDMKYHGLTQRNPEDAIVSNYREHPVTWQLEQEFAITRCGVAEHLSELVNGFKFPEKSVVTFKDIISTCPEISQMFELYYGEPSKALYLYDFKTISEKPYKIEICVQEKDEKKILTAIPELNKDFTMSKSLRHNLARVFTSNNISKFPEYCGLYYPPVGGKYIVGGLRYRTNSNYFSRYIDQMVADYFGFFMLSMCVRYKQDFWGEIIQGEKSGVIGLVNLYLSTVKRRFPNAILDRIFGERFEYGTPARARYF